MSIDSFLAVVQLPYQPPVLFCTGLFTSILFCALALLVESTIRRRAVESFNCSTKALSYQRFRRELVSSPRHVGFTADELHEIDDNDFRSK